MIFGKTSLTPEIISSFIHIIEREKNSSGEGEPKAVYTVDTDHSSFESLSPDLFDLSTTIGEKSAEKIGMRFYTTDLSRSIEIHLMQSTGESMGNYIAVCGDDPMWVNKITGELYEILGSAESDPSITNWMKPLMFLSCAGQLFLYFNILAAHHRLMVSWLSFLIAGIIPIAILQVYRLLLAYVNSMSPFMELRTSNHPEAASRHLNRISWILAAILLPLAIETSVYIFSFLH